MNKIYLATRLYNLDDKLRTCKLENYLKERFDDVSVYMPYRDSDEENISADNWKQDIFTMDIKAINECDILIGYIDGPEFDEGVGFEIGYALTKQKNVYIINSDFISYSIDGTISKNIDPIIDYFEINIVSKKEYTIDNSGFCESLENLSQELLELISFDTKKNITKLQKQVAKNEYFIETGNSRLFYYLVKDKNISKRVLKQSVKNDIENILSSKKVYILSNDTEMHFGSAIIAGICYGLDIPFYIIDDKKIYLSGHNNVLMKTNLMIDVASSGYIDIEEFIDEL